MSTLLCEPPDPVFKGPQAEANIRPLSPQSLPPHLSQVLSADTMRRRGCRGCGSGGGKECHPQKDLEDAVPRRAACPPLVERAPLVLARWSDFPLSLPISHPTTRKSVVGTQGLEFDTLPSVASQIDHFKSPCYCCEQELGKQETARLLGSIPTWNRPEIESQLLIYSCFSEVLASDFSALLPSCPHALHVFPL